MTLYHGSSFIVERPQVLNEFTGRDFGVGFYTTTIKQQAIGWSVRKAKIDLRAGKKSIPILNSYECKDFSELNDLEIKIFEGVSMEWLDFVVANRSNPSFTHEFDIVIGSIANDNVGETVAYVIAGVITKEVALERLKFEKINDQVCFNTTKSLEYLKYIGHTEC